MLANFKFVFNLGLASLSALHGASQPIDRVGSGLQIRADDKPCHGQTQIISPKAGQVVDATQPIEIVYCSSAYFKIQTTSTKVLWASSEKAPGLYGYDVGELASADSLGLAGFKTSVTRPTTDSLEGSSRYIYVLETMTQYGSNDIGFQLSGVEVKLA